MKKLLLALALAIGVQAQAQIVSSTSSVIKYQKKEKKTTWYFKPGFSVMKMTGDGADDSGAKVGYNFGLGFQMPIKQKGAYWGMELGLGSRGWSYNDKDDSDYDQSAIAHNVQLSPFTFGWKIDLGDKVKLDPHIGAYVSVDYKSKVSYDDETYDWDEWSDEIGSRGCWPDYNCYDVGMNLGVGVWYDRFNFDITWQRGFIDAFTELDGFKTSNVMFRLGIAF